MSHRMETDGGRTTQLIAIALVGVPPYFTSMVSSAQPGVSVP